MSDAPTTAPTVAGRARAEHLVLTEGLTCDLCDAPAGDRETAAWIDHLRRDPEPLPWWCRPCTTGDDDLPTAAAPAADGRPAPAGAPVAGSPRGAGDPSPDNWLCQDCLTGPHEPGGPDCPMERL